MIHLYHNPSWNSSHFYHGNMNLNTDTTSNCAMFHHGANVNINVNTSDGPNLQTFDSPNDHNIIPPLAQYPERIEEESQRTESEEYEEMIPIPPYYNNQEEDEQYEEDYNYDDDIMPIPPYPRNPAIYHHDGGFPAVHNNDNYPQQDNRYHFGASANFCFLSTESPPTPPLSSQPSVFSVVSEEDQEEKKNIESAEEKENISISEAERAEIQRAATLARFESFISQFLNHNNGEHPMHRVEHHGISDLMAMTMQKLPTRQIVASELGTNRKCQICMEHYKEHETVTTLPCIHFFHSQCINPWLSRSDSCPECRHNICRYEVDIN